MLATFTVNVAYDANTFDDQDSVVTLREATIEANDDPDADTIDFAPGLDGSTITLGIDENGQPLPVFSLAALSITESVTITTLDSNGDPLFPNGLTIDASGNDNNVNVDDGGGTSVFDIQIFAGLNETDDVTLAGLTITGGDTASHGGGVSFNVASTDGSNATLTIDKSVIEGNHAQLNGGGVFASDPLPGGLANVIISGSTIQDNEASATSPVGLATTGGGGAYFESMAAVTIDNC